jgi:hypothetical protein
VVTLFLFPLLPTHAADSSSTALSVFKFTSGVIAAYAIHETGHFLVAEATGTDLNWKVGSYNQPLGYTESGTSDTKGVAVNSAGLTSQIAGSEVVLQCDSIDKNNDFVRGMLAWNIVNPIIYSLDYWFIRRTNRDERNKYRGDIEGIEYYSNRHTANMFAFSITAIAAFQGWRFLKTQTWAPEWVQEETHALNFAPAGGASDDVSLSILMGSELYRLHTALTPT